MRGAVLDGQPRPFAQTEHRHVGDLKKLGQALLAGLTVVRAGGVRVDKCALSRNGTRPSASNGAGCVVGMSFVVRMLGPAIAVPARAPM
ncbi:hypothetical protein APR04_004632 [Promicromonospora umidemergens]|uniref:Uncharacterized protein n=1 Tax=Promicromonospora umidemergens TaxID=629679 RepID=A0ABP8XZD9_9MICO|nr:hypothetical protein [Promicromonospora umidemergens]MCP2285697.1 hypothetical protein [Promicromonospora umidemergens]